MLAEHPPKVVPLDWPCMQVGRTYHVHGTSDPDLPVLYGRMSMPCGCRRCRMLRRWARIGTACRRLEARYSSNLAAKTQRFSR